MSGWVGMAENSGIHKLCHQEFMGRLIIQVSKVCYGHNMENMLKKYR